MLDIPHKSGPLSIWDTDLTATLISLWNGGHSASSIAAELGSVSRSAVLGKVNRLGLSARETVNRKPRVVTQGSGPRRPAMPPPTAPTLEHRVTFFALENQHCRFPLWSGDEPLAEWFYCGSPKAAVPEGGPYCRWHHKHTHNGFPHR